MLIFKLDQHCHFSTQRSIHPLAGLSILNDIESAKFALESPDLLQGRPFSSVPTSFSDKQSQDAVLSARSGLLKLLFDKRSGCKSELANYTDLMYLGDLNTLTLLKSALDSQFTFYSENCMYQQAFSTVNHKKLILEASDLSPKLDEARVFWMQGKSSIAIALLE